MNVSLIQSKGGTTKSTIAANLAAWLSGKGHDVATLDLDGGKYGNRTLSLILETAAIPISEPQDVDQLRKLLSDRGEQYHFIVADAPGGFQHTAEMNLELLRHTDFALVPVKPDLGDIEPLFVVQEIIAEAKCDNPFLEARVVINCVDGRTTEGRNLETTKQDIRSFAPNLPVMNHSIKIDTNAFKTARAKGIAVVDGPKTGARMDFESVFSELLADMVVSINKYNAPRAANRQSSEDVYEAIVNG